MDPLTHPAPLVTSSAPVELTDRLLLRAAALQRSARQGALPQLLRGKRLALLCDDPGSDAAICFMQAAHELGAHVATVRSGLTAGSPLADVQHTGLLLGRLYDAVECQGAVLALAPALAQAAEVPVFAGSALPSHASATVATALRGPAAAGRRCRALQAWLLDALGC